MDWPLFAETTLDRMDERRGNVKPDDTAKLILFQGDDIVFRNSDRAYLHAPHDVACDLDKAIFLGGNAGRFYFAACATGTLPATHGTVDIRSFAEQGFAPDKELGLVAEASSLIKWHASHGFCAHCGKPTVIAHGGWRRDCEACGRQHFPRTDPVVIMLVTHGEDCLLGSGRNFKVENRYSCLAGFMEPGETIEAAAARELFEEAGLRAKSVRYMCSQPWPFPSSLMIGVHIEAENRETRMDDKELKALRWIPKTEIAAALNGADKDFSLPGRIAIARFMLEAWVSGTFK